MSAHASLWSDTVALPSFPAVSADTEVDVLVVGGGITGMTAALLLASSGKRVMLVEARRIGGGVTGDSTVHLTEAVDTRYHEIASSFGDEGAHLVARSSRAAIEQVSALIREHAIDCDFVRRPGYLFTEKPDQVGELERERSAAATAGLSVTLLPSAPLPFPSAGALVFPDQAQMHGLRYLAGITTAARRRGALIHEASRVLTIDDGEPCTVHLEHGPVIRARKVFVATHAPLNRVFLQTKIHAYRSYVLACPNVPLADGLFWDTEDPYHYFSRFSVDGTPYLIVGGEDHKTGADVDTERHYAALQTWVDQRFTLPMASHSWSAQVEEPVDGLPYIGRNSMSENVFVATGFSGNGITFGTVAAQIVSDLVDGRDNPAAKLYAATRIKPLASAAEYVSENIDFPMHFINDRLHPVDVKTADEIAPGQGRTLRVRGQRLGVYRDPGGALHAVSAVCTHLGCLVNFNATERSWDCPCHGSRFGIDGAVLDGPATRGLAKREL